MSHRARFISSYQGAATHEIAETYVSGLREVIEVRYRAFDDGRYAPGVFEGRGRSTHADRSDTGSPPKEATDQ